MIAFSAAPLLETIWNDAPVIASKCSFSSAAACFSASVASGCWVMSDWARPSIARVKVACAFLYLLSLPGLLRLWPFTPSADKRVKQRLDAGRILTWFPYCGLFTTLFVTPSSDDLEGLLRFFGLSFAVAAVLVALAIFMRWRGVTVARGLYTRVIPPYAVLVLAIVLVTSIQIR